jgi:hypothetical protein
VPEPSGKLEKDPEFLSKIITGDETGLQYNPQTKQQFRLNIQKSPCPKKVRQSSLKFEHPHCFFFFLFIQRVVHYEFVTQGQTVNQHCYIDTLQRLWEKCSKNYLKIGICGIVFSTMTTHLITLLCLCVNFWLPIE